MWVERVEAIGFGPLSGARLELAEGMTLVFGPNEAGKSSWHEALYAGVCGVRRSRGARSTFEKEFELRHRPWGGGPWQVRAVVGLAHGRRVELAQDLSARTGTARDYATGREVTSEILVEQTPDASWWLGLDRDAFKAVACVPQTALLQILNEPEELAEHLQRAAATAGADATAAEAIKRIEDFLAEQVGTDRAYTRPLAKAKNALSTAADQKRRAEGAHAEMAQLREELREARRVNETAECQLRCAEAAAARRRADAAQDLWKRAEGLSIRYPEPPLSLAADDALAQQARVAVDGYRNRPMIRVLEEPTAAALEAELAKLPESPSGDLKPAAEVEDAYDKVRAARANLDSLVALQQPAGEVPEQAPIGTSELRELADALATSVPEASPTETAAASEPQAALRRRTSRLLPRVMAAVAVVLLLAGIAAAVLARQPIGWVAAALGALIGVGLTVRILRDHARHIAALQAAGPAGAAREAAEQRRADAQTRVAQLGLPADPKAIRDLADAADRARASAEQRANWERRCSEATDRVQQTLAQLAEALSIHGVLITTNDPEQDFRRYREECDRREDQAAQAARREDLQARLDNRRQAEEQAADALLRRSNAEEALRTAGSDCGLPESDITDLSSLAVALEKWLEHRERTLDQRDQATGDYALLQDLIGDGTPKDLQDEADRLARAADAAAEGLDPADVAGVDLGPDPVETLKVLHDTAQEARDHLTELQTTEHVQEQGVPSVAAGEEAVAQAAARVAQLERLGHILTTAREFLVRAQEIVHRTIAPQLADAIAPHLATVTDNRYTEVRVDPDGLQVLVRPTARTWREAARLSHGTAEQVYLLLRAALAQYLVTTSESCPLILDDPTAYADAARTTAVLQVLHRISVERQVVVFSHDAHVLQWAQHALVSPRDKVIELQGLAPA